MPSTTDRVSAFERVSKGIDAVTGIVCAISFGIMTVLVILGVFFRYILNAPLNWVEEVSRYLMIWGASLSISLGVSAGEHVGLTVILDSLRKPAARKAMAFLINFTGLVFLAFMFIVSIPSTAEARYQATLSLGISMFLPKLAVPVAMGISALQMLIVTIRILMSRDGRIGESVGYLDI
jgi:TRAP-type C4-dicarboxylate transport system permease small subunit